MPGLTAKKIRTEDGDWFLLIVEGDREASGATARDTSRPLRKQDLIGVLHRSGVTESEIQFVISQAESEWLRLQEIQ